MNGEISFKELQQFFKYTEQAMKDNKTTVIIDNEMCRFLYKYLKKLDNYFNMQDKEIERLTNNWNELEEWVKQNSWFYNTSDGCQWIDQFKLLDKMEEISGRNGNERNLEKH